MVHGFIWNKEEQGADADVESKLANTREENSAIVGIQTELQSVTKMLMTTKLVYSPNPNDRARRPAGFNIACYRNRSCTYSLNCLANRTTF